MAVLKYLFLAQFIANRGYELELLHFKLANRFKNCILDLIREGTFLFGPVESRLLIACSTLKKSPPLINVLKSVVFLPFDKKFKI